LHVTLSAAGYKIFDQNRKLKNTSVKVAHGANEIELRIPLEVLGNPRYVLTSAHTYLLSSIPLDWVSWQTLELPQNPLIPTVAKEEVSNKPIKK
jgi:hypothetical protein